MRELFDIIVMVLAVEFRLGGVNLTLGGVALGVILLKVGANFYHDLQDIDGDQYDEQGDNIDAFLQAERNEQAIWHSGRAEGIDYVSKPVDAWDDEEKARQSV